MIENKTIDGLDRLNGLTGDDTASIFCFSVEPEMLDAYNVIEQIKPPCWVERRKAKPGAIYPYWLICRSDVIDQAAAFLKEAGIHWDDVESHYYNAVKDQSELYSSAQNFTSTTNNTESAEKKWWQFWK